MRSLAKILPIIIISIQTSTNQAFVAPPTLSTTTRKTPSSFRNKRILQVRRQLSAASEESTMITATSLSLSALPLPDATDIAKALGYLVGAASLLLYTPIAVRLIRQKTADGLVTTTWWLKLVSYTASDIYAYTHGYPVSTYIETLIITVEAAAILGLVIHFQQRADAFFWSLVLMYGTMVLYLLYAVPVQIVALGQGMAAILNTGALIPQFLLNNERQKAGDYSPVTAGLAAAGCLVRIFTTIELAGSDLLLLASFSVAFVFNSALFAQIMYLGTQVEGRPFRDVLLADLQNNNNSEDLESSRVVDLSLYQREENEEGIFMVSMKQDIMKRNDTLPLRR
jgi:mannose-P-dolichol utilization defect protein 1